MDRLDARAITLRRDEDGSVSLVGEWPEYALISRWVLGDPAPENMDVTSDFTEVCIRVKGSRALYRLEAWEITSPVGRYRLVGSTTT